MHSVSGAEILDMRNPIGIPRDSDHFEMARRKAERIIDREVRVELAECQQEALVSLLIDLVTGVANSNGTRFEQSDLLKYVNDREWQLASAEFMKFVYAGKRVHPKLWKKRDEEQLLFRRGVIPS